MLDPRWKKKGDQGFTLIEVFLVVALLSVTAVLAVPQLNVSYQQMLLRTTASDIAYLMRYAQNRAMLDQRLVRLKFLADFSQYGLLEAREETGNDPGTPDFIRITGRMGKTFLVPAQIAVQGEKPELTFFPDGMMEKGDIRVCYKKRCLLVSTKQQRGMVHILEVPLGDLPQEEMEHF